MKRIVGILLVVLLFASCKQQPKQWYSTSPEVDLVKQVDASFASGDWATFRAAFADTAKIWVNTTWNEPSMSADTLTANYKSARGNMTEAKLTNSVYEMIVTDEGNHWVHRWGVWEAKLANGKTSSWASNSNFLVSDGKIRMGVYIFNALPNYLASQPDPTPAGTPAK
ncbi:MAG: hypothetical protein JNL40_07240 [Cyclobacteriaceae bacterium]|nr:hypothetical protein [Cyclobacteriaceae bacterium]